MLVVVRCAFLAMRPTGRLPDANGLSSWKERWRGGKHAVRLTHLLVLVLVCIACAKSSVPADTQVLWLDSEAHRLTEKLCSEQCFNLVSLAQARLCVGIPDARSIAEPLPCESVKGQRFAIVKEDSTWALRTLDGRCLGVADNSRKNGAVIEAQRCSKASNQVAILWSEPSGGVSTKIRFAHSNKCLDVSQNGAGGDGKMIQTDCVDNLASQQFYIADVTNLPDLSNKIDLDLTIKMDANARSSANVNNLEDAIAGFEPKQSVAGKDIYFVVANGLRWDYVRRLAPTVSKFIDENLGGRGIAASTDTYHSSWATMFSEPPHLRTPNNGSGPFWLRLLRKQGYKTFGIGATLSCANDMVNGDWDRILTSYFGQDRSLLSNCNDGVDYSDELGAIPGYKDGAVVSRVIDLAKRNVGNAFYFIHLNATQMNFSWDQSIDANHPFVSNTTFYHGNTAVSVRGYEDAVQSVDLEFGRLLEFLRSTGRYEISTIIFVSNNGTLLGEKPLGVLYGDVTPVGVNGRVMGNGTSLHSEINEIPIAIKVPRVTMDKFAPQVSAAKGSVFSQMDIIPTMLQGIGLSDFAYGFVFGRSLFSPQAPRTSALASKAELFGASPYMILVNKKYKILIKVEHDSLDEVIRQRQFKVIDITDLNDQNIYSKGVFAEFGIEGHGKIKDLDGLTNFIKSNFADALKTLFAF